MKIPKFKTTDAAQSAELHPIGRNISRRRFIGTGAAAGAGLLGGSWISSSRAHTSPTTEVPDENAPWFEATIPQLQAQMASGVLTSRALTLAYLRRIDRLNPLLHAVIETNPNAVDIAARLDNERRAGR